MRRPRSLFTTASNTSACCGTVSGVSFSKLSSPARSSELWHSVQYDSSMPQRSCSRARSIRTVISAAPKAMPTTGRCHKPLPRSTHKKRYPRQADGCACSRPTPARILYIRVWRPSIFHKCQGRRGGDVQGIIRALVPGLLLAAGLPSSAQHATAFDIENGARAYQGTCAACHGPDGNLIAGIDFGRGLFRRPYTDDEMARIIIGGIPNTPMAPSPAMAAGAGAADRRVPALAARNGDRHERERRCCARPRNRP